MVGIEAFAQYIVQQYHGFRYLVFQEIVYQAEVIFVIQHIQVLDGSLVGDVSSGEAGYLVEDGKCITHTPIRFLGDDCQCFRLSMDTFLLGYILQVCYGILHIDAVEVIDLASAQDGRQNLVLLGGSQDEYGMMRRFFQCLQECIEGRLRKHVNLVDDVYLVLADLWRDAYLVNQGTDIVHRVVRCSIEFVYVVRALFVECHARFALVASFPIGCR